MLSFSSFFSSFFCLQRFREKYHEVGIFGDESVEEFWKVFLDHTKCFCSHFSKDKVFLRMVCFVLDT